ncbi:hypothetical protein CSQ89_07525 [Chitinimonas sp. BJB300]|nr:hypothetical protein CSQ89_07525 [Chitinimonas sp. BJB300]
MQTISGVATADTPLQGTIIIRDNIGTMKTATLQTDGHFSFDVSQMKSPFMLRAEGDANDEHFVLYSAATDADGNGHFNVNALTNLIVTKTVEQSAETYYQAGNYHNLSFESLNNQEAAVQARIQPLLTAADVPENINLRRQAYPDDWTGMHAVLQILDIQIDPAHNEAGLRNRLSGQILSEPLNNNAGNGTFNISTDITKVLQEMPSIASVIKQSVEYNHRTKLMSIINPNYLNDGINRDAPPRNLDELKRIPDSWSSKPIFLHFKIRSYHAGTLSVDIMNRPGF